MGRPRKVILCVDDDEQRLSVLKCVLENRGNYRVVPARNGKHAIALFGDGKRLDLVVTELAMYGISGNELIRRLKEINRDVHMILTSRDLKTYLVSQADAFLPAGTEPAELLERVKVLASRKRGPKGERVQEQAAHGA